MSARVTVLLGVVLVTSLAAAAELGLADLRLSDQHDEEHALAPDTRVVLFAGDMDASRLVHAALEDRPADHLDRHRAVFIADIHRMPGIITRLFALPKMRKYPYRMLLIRDDETGRRFPRREGAVTVLHLKGLEPVRTEYVDDAAGLEPALSGAAPAP